MDSKNLYSRQNDQYQLDAKKLKKLDEKFQPSVFYSRAVYYRLFQELAAQELKKHKAEHNRDKLPPLRNAQITLVEAAYELLDSVKINDEEYAEFLYQVQSQCDKKMEVTLDEFEKVLPQIEMECPDAGKDLRSVLASWKFVEEKVAAAQRKAEDSKSFYDEAVKKLANAENKPSMAQVELEKLRDNKRKLETEHYNDKEKLFRLTKEVSNYRNLVFPNQKGIILEKIINQRVQQRFERKKDQAFAGALLYIQKISILQHEYNNDEDDASGNTYLGKIKNLGSCLYRGIFNVLANQAVADKDKASRLYKHPHLTERAQQKCMSLFRDFAVHYPQLFTHMGIDPETKKQYFDSKKIGNEIQTWKDTFNWQDEAVKRPALKPVKSGYDKKRLLPARDSKNIADFMSKDVDNLRVYERSRAGKWTPSTKKVMAVIEADRLLKVYNKTAPFKNIERVHTRHTSGLLRPKDSKVFKNYNEMEELRRKFELEETVSPNDIVAENSRSDFVVDRAIKDAARFLKNARSRVLGERKYPSQPEARAESAAYIDGIHRRRDAILSQIRCESGFYLMPTLPRDLNADKYNDTYIYARDTQRVYYIRDHRTEEVRIENRDKFQKSLIEVMGNEEFKYLSNTQINILMPTTLMCMLTRLPAYLNDDKWNDAYIFSTEAGKLFYIRNGHSEEVNIADKQQFYKALFKVMQDTSIKYLTNREVDELITSNGGHCKRAFKVYPEGYPSAHRIVMDPQKVAKVKAFGPSPHMPKPLKELMKDFRQSSPPPMQKPLMRKP